jgi:hypothetical protein
MLLPNGYSHPKERRVVEVRKEGKSYRQIAEEARISTSRPSNLEKSRNFSKKLGYCLCTSFDFKAILNLE